MVPPSSQRVSRVRWYSGSSSRRVLFAYGAITLCRRSSQSVRLFLRLLNAVLTPERLLLPVWPLPLSLATTSGISVDFSSSPYLDVSVQAVPLIYLFDSVYDAVSSIQRIAPFGHLRINTCLQFPAAFRSLPRPSSAPNAKAFALRSF